MNIVVLMLGKNIVGRELLEELGKRSMAITGVIVETNTPAAADEETYLQNDFYNPPTFDDIVARHPTEVIEVQSLNSDVTKEHLTRLSPDIILLDGGKKIKRMIFEIAKIGTLNSHPGILPQYQGVDVVKWSIYHGDPVGATCHFIDDHLDTGPILIKQEVSYRIGETLLQIKVRVMRVCIDVMIRATKGLMLKTIEPCPQPKEGAQYFTWAPPEVGKKVEEILAGKPR